MKYYYKYEEIDDTLYGFVSDATELSDVAEEIAEVLWGLHGSDLHWDDGDHFDLEIYDENKKKLGDVQVWVDFSHPVFHAEVGEGAQDEIDPTSPESLGIIMSECMKRELGDNSPPPKEYEAIRKATLKMLKKAKDDGMDMSDDIKDILDDYEATGSTGGGRERLHE